MLRVFPGFLRIEAYQTPTMERNISTAARNGEPRWKSLTGEDMKANTVVFTSHAGIKTVDVAKALVTQGYTDVASVQITNSNLTKVTLLSATQTDALLGHGFFIGDSHFSVRPAFTKQLQLHIFDIPIWIENTVICSALAAFGQIRGDIRHGQIQTPSGITVGTGMRFATIELKEGCRQVPSFVRTADQHQFRVRHEDQRATCRICMGEHFARSCLSKRPTNKPPTNTQSTNLAALPGSQLSSGTSAPGAGGSEADVSASSGSSCTNTDPSAEPESSNQSTSSARTRTEPKGSHSYASKAQQGARAQFNCMHGAAEQVSTAPDGSPTTVHLEKGGLLAVGHKCVKLWFFSNFFLQSPMESSSNYVSEVFLSKKQTITRIGFRPGFTPKALNWENHKNPGRLTPPATC